MQSIYLYFFESQKIIFPFLSTDTIQPVFIITRLFSIAKNKQFSKEYNIFVWIDSICASKTSRIYSFVILGKELIIFSQI